ncbi:MAG: hypothetical protein HY958_00560 [Bacteroidia bacterium]|nr:hypothetical protein [Bacteroidia bacterium]
MKKIQHISLVISLCFFYAGSVSAQDDSPFSLGADVMSRYIWRGVNLGGSSPSIQPWLKYTVSTKDTTHVFTVSAWGAYSVAEFKTQETDLILSYTFKNMVTFWLTDYFCFKDTILARNKYFNYNQKTTGHIFEPGISFYGTQEIPFTLSFFMNVYGADAKKTKEIRNDTVIAGDIFMSKYIELGYKKTIKGVDFNPFIGAALDDPNENKREPGYYANKSAGVINLGIKVSKKIKITDKYELPVQAILITNPEAENIYFVFGISF